MKMSHRAKRMERRRKRSGVATINLVSLMDIFTILVFFLLVNSSNDQQVPSTKVIQLPNSLAERLPKDSLTILVTRNHILVNGRQVADVDAAINSQDRMIPALAQELRYQASRTQPAALLPDGTQEREVNILGDKEIPYQLLKKIMLTCSDSTYSRISLAVVRKTEEKSS